MVRCSILAAATLAAPAAFAQRAVPFQMGIPVAPQGLAHRPLGDGPFDYATGEGQDIRVVVVTKALSYPFSMTWLPDGTMLVAQRNGELRTIKNGKLDPKPVSGGPKAYFAGESGLPGAVHGYMDVVLHPQYAQNQLIYLSYTKPVGDNRNHAAVARMKWTAERAHRREGHLGRRRSDAGRRADRVRQGRHAVHRDQRRRRPGEGHVRGQGAADQ